MLPLLQQPMIHPRLENVCIRCGKLKVTRENNFPDALFMPKKLLKMNEEARAAAAQVILKMTSST